jgi:hypothetical protein
MADTKKDAFDELGLESGAFEALERDFQQVLFAMQAPNALSRPVLFHLPSCPTPTAFIAHNFF